MALPIISLLPIITCWIPQSLKNVSALKPCKLLASLEVPNSVFPRLKMRFILSELTCKFKLAMGDAFKTKAVDLL